MSAKITEKTSLYSREGGADKQYTVWLEEQAAGFTVQFQFGPRGGTVQGGTKTKAPVSQEEARKIYEKVLKEKRAKGYSEGEDAPSFSQTEGAKDSGLRPMLLTDASSEDPETYLADPSWGAQQKMNGKRIMIRTTAGGVVGSNRRGLECPIPEIVRTELAYGDADLDGEMIGDVYHAFDLLQMGDRDFRQEPYSERHAELDSWRPTLKHFKTVPLVIGEKAKRALYEKLQADHQEGIVFKKLAGVYLPGKVENLKKSVAVKVKFYTEGSFLVLDWNKGTSSVQVAALDGKKTISVGNVTVAAKYVDQIKKGDVIRVRYLYATAAEQLYQPCLDATDDGSVIASGSADKLSSLKHEGKDE